MLVKPRLIGWSASVVASDDRTVTVYFSGGNICTGILQRIEVIETPTRVTFHVYLGVARIIKPTPHLGCTDEGHGYATTVELAAPLGGRQIDTSLPAIPGPPAVSHL